MNSEDRQIDDDPHKLVWNLRVSWFRKTREAYLTIILRKFHTWRNIKKDFENNRFKISGPIESELSGGSYPAWFHPKFNPQLLPPLPNKNYEQSKQISEVY